VTPLARILGSVSTFYVMVVLVIAADTLLAIQVILGQTFARYMMIVVLFIWTTIAFMHSRGRQRNLEHWERSLDNLHETNELCNDYASLLGEACGSLSTWDREEAEEIVQRAKTIGRLRQANFDERMGNDRDRSD